MVRATNRPPAPSAKAQGFTGRSSDPAGEVGERVPVREVGEPLLGATTPT